MICINVTVCDCKMFSKQFLQQFDLMPPFDQCHAADLAVQFRQSRTQWVQVHRLCMAESGGKHLKISCVSLHCLRYFVVFVSSTFNFIELHLSTLNG